MAVVDKPSCKVPNQAYSWLALDEITKNIWGGIVMNCDLFLYQMWINFLQVKKVNAYCLAIDGGQPMYPLCKRYIRNLKFVESSDLIEKLYRIFQIEYITKRSVFAQKSDWGGVASCDALALISDGQTWGYVYVMGVDKTSKDIICFDPCTKENPKPFLSRIAIQTSARLHNRYDQNIYAVPPRGFQKALFAAILDTKYVDRLGYDIDIIYDDISRLDSLLYRKRSFSF